MTTYIFNTCDCSGTNVSSNNSNLSFISSVNSDESTQKIIWKQVRVPSSLYTMNLKSQIASNDIKSNITKHDSYDRYLAKKKYGHLRENSNSVSPIQGNKTKKYGIGTPGSCKC
tara:strand:- start:2076 stop:2417 length:342 start_codon:yes stop_codon:yes gene_type:complete